MTANTTLRRYLYLIRFTQKPFRYPSIEDIIAGLPEKIVGKRTIERDFATIRNEYGISIKHEPYKKGYYLDIPLDEDIRDFENFVELLERQERMDFLNKTITNVHEAGQYLQLEQHSKFVGTNNLPILWEALRSQRAVSFEYMPYKENPIAEQRNIEPGLIFEYRNRWYLDGWDLERKGVRTFGLDRITALVLTDKTVNKKHLDNLKNIRQHVIGVTSPADATAEKVVLRFINKEAHYLKSLPLHPSQKIINETTTHTDFELTVILNHELMREVLAFGELVEVLEPQKLREEIAERVVKLGKKYLQ